MGNEEEAAAYLEKIGKSGSIYGLDGIRGLMRELGDVQDRLDTVHVAGTNGKGSVCAMLTSILMEAGYRVGTYVSPAVFGRREQYQIDREPIPEEKFADVISRVKAACGRMAAKGMRQPTVFEVETAAAFFYFYEEGCQVAVIETGMGGAQDATNILKRPRLSVITSISFDHMGFLGDSLAEIARAKAGIIKENGRAVALKPRQEEARRAIEDACREKRASLTYADDALAENVCLWEGGLRFSYREQGEIRLPLMGAYQAQNGVCAIEAAKALREGGLRITDGQIRRGLAKTRWEGRFSILCEEPLFVMDGAHNEDAAKKLRETLEMGFTNRKIIYIIGVLADKEHRKMLEIMLPLAHQALTVTPGSPRALDGRLLAEEAGEFCPNVSYCPKISLAVRQAMELAGKDEAMVVAFGSLSYLAEVREAVGGLRKKLGTRGLRRISDTGEDTAW